MTNFTNDQMVAALIAAEIAKLVVLQQWMTREEARAADQEIATLRERQLVIETRIELAD